jgi:hypothetical protein
VRDGEDLTKDGFSAAADEILLAVSKAPTSKKGFTKTQIVIMPVIEMEKIDKYKFIKQGGMYTAWYDTKDWKKQFNAGEQIIGRILGYGWDIDSFKIQITYEKPPFFPSK